MSYGNNTFLGLLLKNLKKKNKNKKNSILWEKKMPKGLKLPYNNVSINYSRELISDSFVVF